MSTTDWFLLVMSIPGQQGSDRVRIWRALKSLGTAVLRDGVYLAPASAEMGEALYRQRDAVREIGGNAYVFRQAECEQGDEALFVSLFDHSEDYAALIDQISSLRDALPALSEAEARRRQAQLRRELDGMHKMDFFTSVGRDEANSAMAAFDDAANAHYSPDEPESKSGALRRRSIEEFRGRLWATRKKIWVDRVASAWLIKRFVDPQARFAWLEKPSECPNGAVGFDFDGAEFSHVGDRVTFQVLLHCFDLETDTALSRIGALVNYLDVGGIPIPEASGFAAMLAGARQRYPNDDELLGHASALLDFLFDAYTAAAASTESP